MTSRLDAEVAVIGVGTMGAMALWQLARRGVECLGFEQFRVGHELGAGAGESRQFRDNYLEPEVRDVMPLAEREYRRLEAESGLRLLTLTGGLTIGSAESRLVTDLVARIRAEGDEPRILTHREVRERFPQHRLADDDVVVWNDRSGFIRPEQAVVAAHGCAVARGARIVEGHAVTHMEPRDDAVLLRCAGRAWTARRVVITAGAWTWRLLDVPGSDLGRLLLTWFPTRRDDLFTLDRNPTFTRDVGGTTIYGMPSLTHGTVRIALVGPRSRFADPDQLDRVHVPAAEIDRISGLVSDWMPDVVPTAVRTGTYLDAYTPDGQPLVGPLDPAGRVLVAAGFSGRGFKMAPVIGRILADLATDRRCGADLRPWSPRRFAAGVR